MNKKLTAATLSIAMAVTMAPYCDANGFCH